MRFVSVGMTIVDHTFIMLTNFTSPIRVLLVNMAAMMATSGACMQRTTGMHHSCIKANRSMTRFKLLEMAEIHDAEFITITVIPILHGHGAKPMHLITVRQPKAEQSWFLVAALIAIASGVIVGLGLVILIQRLRRDTQSSESIEMTTTSSYYEYVATTHDNDKTNDSNDINYYISVF